MYRIINSLATSEYSKKLSAVEVNFLGSGDAFQYQESFDIATNIGLMYDCKRWFFTKRNFDDVSEDDFFSYLQSWYSRFSLYLSETFDPFCTVVILTNDLSSSKLSKLQSTWKQTYEDGFEFKIFTTKEEVQEFLIGESDKMLSI